MRNTLTDDFLGLHENMNYAFPLTLPSLIKTSWYKGVTLWRYSYASLTFCGQESFQEKPLVGQLQRGHPSKNIFCNTIFA